MNSSIISLLVPPGIGRSTHITTLLKSLGYSGVITSHPEEVLNDFPKLLVLDGVENGRLINYLTYRWYVEHPGYNLVLLGSYFNPLVYPELNPLNFDFSVNLVTILYHNRSYSFEEPALFDGILTAVRNLSNSSAFFPENPTSGILIFVAGKRDIYTLQKKWDLSIPLFTLETFKNPSSTWALVITSTLPDIELPPIKVVIDTLQDTSVSPTVTGALIPRLRYISQYEADRRARYATLPDSLCYRLCSKNFFDHLPLIPPEEILSFPADRTILNLAMLNLPPVLPPILGDPSPIVEKLTDWKLLTNGKITSLGRFALSSPLTIRSSVALHRWIDKGYPVFPALTILSLLDGYTSGYYWYPLLTLTQAAIMSSTEFVLTNSSARSDYLETNNPVPSEFTHMIQEHAENFYTKFLGRSDLHTLVNIWSDLLTALNGLNWDNEILMNWCRDNSISFGQIRTVRTLLDLLLSNFPGIEVGPFTTEGAIDNFRPIFEELYPTLTRVNMEGVYTDGLKEYRLTPLLNRSLLVAEPPLKLLPLITIERDEDIGINRYIVVGLNL